VSDEPETPPIESRAIPKAVYDALEHADGRIELTPDAAASLLKAIDNCYVCLLEFMHSSIDAHNGDLDSANKSQKKAVQHLRLGSTALVEAAVLISQGVKSRS